MIIIVYFPRKSRDKMSMKAVFIALSYQENTEKKLFIYKAYCNNEYQSVTSDCFSVTDSPSLVLNY